MLFQVQINHSYYTLKKNIIAYYTNTSYTLTLIENTLSVITYFLMYSKLLPYNHTLCL